MLKLWVTLLLAITSPICLNCMEYSNPINRFIKKLDTFDLEEIFLQESFGNNLSSNNPEIVQNFIFSSLELMTDDAVKSYLRDRCLKVSCKSLQNMHKNYQRYKVQLWQILNIQFQNNIIDTNHHLYFLACLDDLEAIIIDTIIEKTVQSKKIKIRCLKNALTINRRVTTFLALTTLIYAYITHSSKPKGDPRKCYDNKQKQCIQNSL